MLFLSVLFLMWSISRIFMSFLVYMSLNTCKSMLHIIIIAAEVLIKLVFWPIIHTWQYYAGGNSDGIHSLQALCLIRTSVDVSSSHAKMVPCVKPTVKVSDAFAPNKAKTGACMGERPARLHFQAVTTTSVKMEEYALPYSSTVSTLTSASALPASQVLNARLPQSSHSSPRDTCT